MSQSRVFEWRLLCPVFFLFGISQFNSSPTTRSVSLLSSAILSKSTIYILRERMVPGVEELDHMVSAAFSFLVFRRFFADCDTANST